MLGGDIEGLTLKGLNVRKHYYLTSIQRHFLNLKGSDVLHLGVIGELPIYVYMDEPAQASRKGEMRLIKFAFVRLTQEVLASLEKIPTGLPVKMSAVILDHRCWNANEVSTCGSSKSWPSESNYYYFKTPQPEINSRNLLCFSDDLERLANEVQFKRSSEQPNAQTDNLGPMPKHMSKQLDLAITASRRWWDNVDRYDKDTWPGNKEIIAWLLDQGMEKSRAEKVPSIIRPDWAPRNR